MEPFKGFQISVPPSWVVKELKKAYKKRKPDIKSRLSDFKRTGSKKDGVRMEMFFCLCTPQSKAISCWDAVSQMKKLGYLDSGSHKQISDLIASKGIRFKNNKAQNIIEARGKFNDVYKTIKSKSPHEAREWLVDNIRGYGYKEASHFLRNIGFEDLAILDRHILKNLQLCGVLDEIPKTLTKKSYFEIEKSFRNFSKNVGIKMDELDLLFWSEESGLIFK